MLKVADEHKGLEIDITLSEQEKAILAAYAKSEPFDIMQRLMESQVRKFNLRLINSNASDEKEILANFYRAKAVTQFYAGFMERLQNELEIEANNRSNIGTMENPENSTEIDELA